MRLLAVRRRSTNLRVEGADPKYANVGTQSTKRWSYAGTHTSREIERRSVASIMTTRRIASVTLAGAQEITRIR